MLLTTFLVLRFNKLLLRNNHSIRHQSKKNNSEGSIGSKSKYGIMTDLELHPYSLNDQYFI